MFNLIQHCTLPISHCGAPELTAQQFELALYATEWYNEQMKVAFFQLSVKLTSQGDWKYLQ